MGNNNVFCQGDYCEYAEITKKKKKKKKKTISPSLGEAGQHGPEYDPDGIFNISETLTVAKLCYGVELVGKVITMSSTPELWSICLEGWEVIKQVQVQTARKGHGQGLGFGLG